MDDHTIISLVGIGAGVALLIVGMAVGNLTDAIVAIAAAAIGAGVGVPLGVAMKKNEGA
jgi:membrane associated rhomboid family serine protease